MKKISWSWDCRHGTILGLDSDNHSLYRPRSGESVAGYDAITRYSRLAVELADAGDLSRSLQELKLIVPGLREQSAAPIRAGSSGTLHGG